METKSTKVSKNEIYSTIDISSELKGVSKSDKNQLKEEIGELLVEQILESLADSKTPIEGGEYKSTLSKGYAKYKKEEAGNTEPNLNLTGELYSSIDYRIKGDSIQIGVFDSENAGKADGHNNFSGKSKLKTRQFLPQEGQTFKKDIRSLVSETVDNYKADVAELDEAKLDSINSKSELIAYLKDELGIESTAALKRTVLGSRSLSNILDDFDLLDLIDG